MSVNRAFSKEELVTAVEKGWVSPKQLIEMWDYEATKNEYRDRVAVVASDAMASYPTPPTVQPGLTQVAS